MNMRRMTHVRVTLMPSDTYLVEFVRVARSLESHTVAVHDDVYADQIRSLVESTTGLYLSLGTMGAHP